MSLGTVTDVLSRIDNGPVLVGREHAPSFGRALNDLRAAGSMSVEAERLATDRRNGDLCSLYGYGGANRDKPFVYSDGVAVIPVHGALINRFYGSWGYVTGYNFIRGQLNAALDDEDVEVIVLDVNSYGGEAAGCFELADEIFAARDKKSLLAVVDSNCCSAAYAIASATSKVYVTPSGQAGSIGVIAMHVSYEKMLERQGIEITLMFEDDHKADGNPFQALPDDVRKEIKAQVAKRHGEFVELVAKNRGLDSQAVRDTKSKTFRAAEAKALKLIDEVKTPTDAVASFLAELGSEIPSDNEEGEDDMAETPTPAADANANAAPDQAALAAAAQTAKTAERQRASAIMDCDEAKERPALARHIALSTDLSVEDAKAMLGKAAVETKTEAPAPAADANATDPAFRQAMDNGSHPNVGADETGDNANGGQPKASRAKAAMALAGFGEPASAAKN